MCNSDHRFGPCSRRCSSSGHPPDVRPASNQKPDPVARTAQIVSRGPYRMILGWHLLTEAAVGSPASLVRAETLARSLQPTSAPDQVARREWAARLPGGVGSDN